MKEDKNILRIPITFDCTDEKQKMVYDVLKNAGYGQRTPLVVKAMCLLMGEQPPQEPQEEQIESHNVPVFAEDYFEKMKQITIESMRECLPSILGQLSITTSSVEAAGEEGNTQPSGEEKILDMSDDDISEVLNHIGMF